MKFRDIQGKPGTKFAFEDDKPFIPYMILNECTHLGYVSVVNLNDGVVASFGDMDAILDKEVMLDDGTMD